VQAICDFVHQHLHFRLINMPRPTKTAWEAYGERRGVCRDFAHLAITFCRCMNIPARYCAGYLGDIGVPPSSAHDGLLGWFEAYLGGAWYTFGPASQRSPHRAHRDRARRDAADVAIITTFGPTSSRAFAYGPTKSSAPPRSQLSGDARLASRRRLTGVPSTEPPVRPPSVHRVGGPNTMSVIPLVHGGTPKGSKMSRRGAAWRHARTHRKHAARSRGKTHGGRCRDNQTLPTRDARLYAPTAPRRRGIRPPRNPRLRVEADRSAFAVSTRVLHCVGH